MFVLKSRGGGKAVYNISSEPLCRPSRRLPSGSGWISRPGQRVQGRADTTAAAGAGQVQGIPNAAGERHPRAHCSVWGVKTTSQ